MTIRLSRRPAAGALATVAAVCMAAIGVTGSSASGAAPPPTAPQPVVVTVTDPGDPATAVDLTPLATVGTTTVVSTKRAMIGTLSAPAMTDTYDLAWAETLRSTVTAANADGSSTVTWVIEDTTATHNAGNITPDEAIGSSEPLVGLPIEIDYDASGAQTAFRAAAGTSPSAEQLQLIADLSASGATGPLVYPADPIGVGASWTATLRLPASWAILPLTYSYRLVAGADDRYTIDYTWSGEAAPLTVTDDAADPGTTMSATVSGSGTITRNAAGTSSVATDHGHHRFHATDGTEDATDEYDLWTEWITNPS